MDTPDELAKVLRSILLLHLVKTGPLSVNDIIREFRELMDTSPDVSRFHFNNLHEFLQSMPEVFKCVGGRWTVVPETQAEVNQMNVMAASKSKPRGGRGGRGSTIRGRPSQFGAAFSNFSGYRGGRGLSHSQSSHNMGARPSFSRNEHYNGGARYNGDRYNGDRFSNRSNNYGGQDNGFYQENGYDRNGDYYQDNTDYARNEGYGGQNNYDGNNEYDGNNDYDGNNEYGGNNNYSGQRREEHREEEYGGQRQSVFSMDNAYDQGGSVFDDPSFRRNYPTTNSSNINSSRDSQESKSSGANGYMSANESSFNHGSEGSHGTSQQFSNEPPPPVLGQTGRTSVLLASKFGSSAVPKETAKIPLQESNHPSASNSAAKGSSNNKFSSPPPGFIGPPPGLENIVRAATFDLGSMKEALTSASPSDSAATLIATPTMTTIQIRDLIEPTIEILRNKWPNHVEGGYLIDLLADQPGFETYMSSFVDQRDSLMNMITSRVNKMKKTVYVQYKEDLSGNEKCLLSFIPGHPQRDSLEKTQEEIFKMTCPLLRAQGGLDIQDIVQRLGIEACFQYAPASLLFATYKDRTDYFTLKGPMPQKVVSLVEGVSFPPWKPSSASSSLVRATSARSTPAPRTPVICNEEPDPPMLGSTRSEIGTTASLLAQAKEKVSKNPVIASSPISRSAPVVVPIVPPSEVGLSTLLRTKNENLLGDDAWMQVHVCHFKDLSTFAIRTVESQIEFKNLSRKLYDLCSVRATTKSSYERGELVCVLIGDDYFRAVVQEASRKEYRVHRIDIGDYIFVEKLNICRLLNEDFIKPAALATKCSVGNYDLRVDDATMDSEEQGFGEVLLTKDKFLRIRIKKFKSDEIVVDVSLDVDGQIVEIPRYFETANYIILR